MSNLYNSMRDLRATIESGFLPISLVSETTIFRETRNMSVSNAMDKMELICHLFL